MSSETRVVPVGHPMQPVVMVDGVERFKSNAIVRFLLYKGPFDMNRIAMGVFSDDDRRQFAQLIGYSVCGYHDLGYAAAPTPPEIKAQDGWNAMDVFNRAARDLPEGWAIAVVLEKGSGTLELSDADGRVVEVGWEDQAMCCQIDEAIRVAIDRAQAQGDAGE